MVRWLDPSPSTSDCVLVEHDVAAERWLEIADIILLPRNYSAAAAFARWPGCWIVATSSENGCTVTSRQGDSVRLHSPDTAVCAAVAYAWTLLRHDLSLLTTREVASVSSARARSACGPPACS